MRSLWKESVCSLSLACFQPAWQVFAVVPPFFFNLRTITMTMMTTMITMATPTRIPRLWQWPLWLREWWNSATGMTNCTVWVLQILTGLRRLKGWTLLFHPLFSGGHGASHSVFLSFSKLHTEDPAYRWSSLQRRKLSWQPAMVWTESFARKRSDWKEIWQNDTKWVVQW